MPARLTRVDCSLIAERICLIRGQKVIIDVDLAELYGVTTKRLNAGEKKRQEIPRRLHVPTDAR